MACIRATPLVWIMVVAVAAIMVAENGRLCSAFDMGEAKDSMMNKAEEAKDTAGSWSSWAYDKISGKLSVDPQDMKQRAQNTMKSSSDSSSDSGSHAPGKLHAVSHNDMGDFKGDNGKFYAQAKRDVGAAYDSMAKKNVIED